MRVAPLVALLTSFATLVVGCGSNEATSTAPTQATRPQVSAGSSPTNSRVPTIERSTTTVEAPDSRTDATTVPVGQSVEVSGQSWAATITLSNWEAGSFAHFSDYRDPSTLDGTRYRGLVTIEVIKGSYDYNSRSWQAETADGTRVDNGDLRMPYMGARDDPPDVPERLVSGRLYPGQSHTGYIVFDPPYPPGSPIIQIHLSPRMSTIGGSSAIWTVG